jgi:hypothetical protein
MFLLAPREICELKVHKIKSSQEKKRKFTTNSQRFKRSTNCICAFYCCEFNCELAIFTKNIFTVIIIKKSDRH